MQQSHGALQMVHSQSPVLIRKHIPASFNLQIMDMKLRKTPARLLSNERSKNPLTNQKVKENFEAPQKKLKIVFRNKSRQQGNFYPSKRIDPKKMLKNVIKINHQQQAIEHKLRQNDQRQQFERALQIENDTLSAKFIFSKELNRKKNQSQNLYSSSSAHLHPKRSSITKNTFKLIKNDNLSTSNTKNTLLGRKSTEELHREEPEFSERPLITRKNSMKINFKRDLLGKTKNLSPEARSSYAYSSQATNRFHPSKQLLASRLKTEKLSKQTMNNKTDASQFKEHQTNPEAYLTVQSRITDQLEFPFQIKGQRAPDSQTEVPWSRIMKRSHSERI